MPGVWRRAVRPASLLVLAAVGLTTSAGCDAARSSPAAIFRPESPGAAAIHDLSVILLVIAVVVLVGVETVLLVAVFRFRNRPEESAVQTHGNLRLEVGWTVATALAILVILGLTVKTMGEVTASPAEALPAASAFPGDTLVMKVVGYQWWWAFHYPQLDIVTANEVYVPVGKTVKVELESADVIHSFWAPRLGGKTDMIPGQTNYTSFLAISPGVYEGECAEFCGLQHAHMAFKIVAVPPAEFSGWVRSQQTAAAQPSTEAQRAGERAFLRLCASCHTVKGTEAAGRSGPDLTHFGSRQTIGAGTLRNSREDLVRWLRDPQEAKPGNLMPNLKVDQATIDQLVAYLESLR